MTCSQYCHILKVLIRRPRAGKLTIKMWIVSLPPFCAYELQVIVIRAHSTIYVLHSFIPTRKTKGSQLPNTCRWKFNSKTVIIIEKRMKLRIDIEIIKHKIAKIWQIYLVSDWPIEWFGLVNLFQRALDTIIIMLTWHSPLMQMSGESE